MRQDDRWSPVRLVIYRAQQDRMRYGDVEQFRGCLVGLLLVGIAQPLGRPAAEQMKRLTLRAHAADACLTSLVSAPINQRALVRLTVSAVPSCDQFRKVDSHLKSLRSYRASLGSVVP